MKKIPLICGLLLCASQSTQAQTLAYDGFETATVGADYTTGGSIVGVNGGSGFSGAWDDSFNAALWTPQNSGLSYLDLVTTDGSLFKPTNGVSRSRRAIQATEITDTTIYFSFLYDRGGTQNNTNDRIAFGEALGQERWRIGNNGSGQFEVTYNNGAVVAGTTTSLDLSDTLFVAGAYEITSASDNVFNLYFNPSDLTDVANTSVDSLTITENQGGVGGFFAIQNLTIRANLANSVYDEFRFAYGTGATIDDVAPIPEPTSAAMLLGAASLLVLRRRR